MPERDNIQGVGDFDLGQVAILGSSGNIVNITEQILELNIFQSIDSPFMSGNIMINDAVGLASILPILGQERLLFTFKTPSGFPINFDNYQAVIYNVDKRFQGANRAQIFLLSFTTLENYRNTRTKVSKSFKGTSSEIVQEILTDPNYLGTKKSLYVDDTINVRTYVAPNIRPYQVIDNLRDESLTTQSEPHFLFYENPRGIHFRSLDSLIGQGGELCMPHVFTYKYQPSDDAKDIKDSLSTIVNWEIEDSSNTLLSGRAGMFASTLTCHDAYNKNIERFEYDYIEDMFKKRNSSNQDNKRYGPMISESPVDGEERLTGYTASRQFVHPKSKATNHAEKWLQESNSRRIEREYFTLNIETFGNTNVMCGDIVDIIIPTNRELSASDVDSFPDPILSGRYLVTDLAHQVNYPSQQHTMIFTAMKDSVTNALPIENIKYPIERNSSNDIGLTQEKRSLSQKTR